MSGLLRTLSTFIYVVVYFCLLLFFMDHLLLLHDNADVTSPILRGILDFAETVGVVICMPFFWLANLISGALNGVFINLFPVLDVAWLYRELGQFLVSLGGFADFRSLQSMAVYPLENIIPGGIDWRIVAGFPFVEFVFQFLNKGIRFLENTAVEERIEATSAMLKQEFMSSKPSDSISSDQKSKPMQMFVNKRQEDVESEFSAFPEVVSDLKEEIKKLEDVKYRDALTGLFTRAYLDREIYHMHKKALSNPNARLSCIFIDIDNFKMINDTYGHERGDDILKAVASIAKLNATMGMACRYGGEEICLVFDSLSHEGVVQCAEDIRMQIRQSLVVDAVSKQPVTISAGVYSAGQDTLRSQNISPDHIIAYADKAMYEAKHSGKDRVCSDHA